MNAKLLKELIKSAVKEVIKEELSDILKEAILNNSKTREVISESRGTAGNSITHTNTNPIFPKKSFDRSAFKQMMDSDYEIDERPKFHPEISDQPQLIESTPEAPVNPYMSFILDAANNMKPGEMASLRNMG